MLAVRLVVSWICCRSDSRLFPHPGYFRRLPPRPALRMASRRKMPNDMTPDEEIDRTSKSHSPRATEDSVGARAPGLLVFTPAAGMASHL